MNRQRSAKLRLDDPTLARIADRDWNDLAENSRLIA